MTTILSGRVAHNIWVATLNVKVTAKTCSKIVSGPLLSYLKSGFTIISQKWSPFWDDMLRATFGSLPWRSRSQHDLVAKTFPAHNFVIWSRILVILQLFDRNDHHQMMTLPIVWPPWSLVSNFMMHVWQLRVILDSCGSRDKCLYSVIRCHLNNVIIKQNSYCFTTRHLLQTFT